MTTSGNPKYCAFVAKSVTCPCCSGAGRVLVQQINKPRTASGDSFYATCPVCGGYGYTVETIDKPGNVPDQGERETA